MRGYTLGEPVMLRGILGAALFSAALFTCSGCSSFETAWSSLVFSAAENIDRSYPVTSAPVMEGVMVFKYKPGLLKKLFRKQAHPVPSNAREIVVSFGFEAEDVPWDWDWKSWVDWIPPERSGGRGGILWGGVDRYYGKCDIPFGDASREGELRIRRNPQASKGPRDPKAPGKNANQPILIVLDSATTETVSLEMRDYITTGNTSRHIPPHYWGEFVLRGKAYRIFSVVEGLYYGWKDSRAESTAYEFLRNGQKFQILDSADAVVAELRENHYTLYDTLPQTEWDDMKQGLALFHAFRCIAGGLL